MAGPYQPLAELLPSPPAAGSLLQSAGTIPGEWKSGVTMPQHAWDNQEWPDCVPDWETYWDGQEILLPGREEVARPMRSKKAQPLAAQNFSIPNKPLHSSGQVPPCEQWYFDPFTVLTPVSETEVSPEQARRLTAEMRLVHEALFSRAVARALFNPETWSGGAWLPPFVQGAFLNPTLGYATNMASLTGILDPLSGFAALLAAYAAATGTTAGAMIHCSPLVIPYLINNVIVSQAGTRYLGPGGIIVVADAGYPIGSIPRDIVNDEFSSPVLGAPQCWMFITGPVEVGQSEARVVEGSQYADIRWNRWALMIEQRAIFRFDPACAFGVPICPPVIPCASYSSSVT